MRDGGGGGGGGGGIYMSVCLCSCWREPGVVKHCVIVILSAILYNYF